MLRANLLGDTISHLKRSMSKRIYPTHEQELKHTIDLIQSFFDKQRYYPRGNVFLDKVVLVHVSKSLTVARAVLSLIDAGFPEEAFGLSRTLVEIALNLRFITNKHSERRAKRFVHYYAKWKMELIRRTLKHFSRDEKDGRPTYSKAELRKMLADYKTIATLARKFPNRTSWTETQNRKASRGGAWMMAQEPDKHEKVDGKPYKWEFDYDWIYFWTSQYVHATVISMEAHATFPREAFSIHIAPQRGQHTADLGAFNTALYLQKMLVMAFRAIKHPFPEELSEPLGGLITKWAKSTRT